MNQVTRASVVVVMVVVVGGGGGRCRAGKAVVTQTHAPTCGQG